MTLARIEVRITSVEQVDEDNKLVIFQHLAPTSYGGQKQGVYFEWNTERLLQYKEWYPGIIINWADLIGKTMEAGLDSNGNIVPGRLILRLKRMYVNE